MNNASIRMKLILTYFIVVIIPICIIGYFLTNRLYAISFSNIISISDANFNQLTGNYANRLEACESVLDGLVNYAPLLRFIETEYDADYEAIDDFNSKISPFIRRVNLDEGDLMIRVYSNNSTIRHSVETSNTLEDLARQDWYDPKAPASASSVRWAVTESRTSKPSKRYFGGYKTLKSMSGTKEIKSVIAVFVNEDELFSLVSAEKQAGMVVFLIDSQGRIVSTTERDLLFTSMNNVPFNQGEKIGELADRSLVRYQNNEYLYLNRSINNSRIGINGWRLAYLVPAKQAFAGIRDIWLSSVLLCVVCIMIALALILFISHNIVGRVKGLIKKINTLVENNFIVEGKISGKDEIGTLENSFINMAGKIYKLIHEVYIANLKIKDVELNSQKALNEKRKAEIHALQGQINPHYLFNTLETIRMNLVLNNDRKNADMVEVFAQSFRLCIGNSRDIHSMREELLFVENYFKIQKYRFGDNILFFVEVPEELLDCDIPKLVLQPLVENAVYHGLEMKGEPGRIDITAREEQDGIHIVVSDDGVGIAPAVLEQLKQELKQDSPSGEQDAMTRIALKNVNSRLRLMYGEGYGLKLASEPGAGTRAEINFPRENSESGRTGNGEGLCTMF